MNKIIKFQNLLIENNIDVFIIPTSDYHMSEYTGNYFKIREYLSGFTGSAGTLVITQHDAKLWTDGRYFIQAEEQLLNSNVELMKSGEPNTPSISDYLKAFKDKTLGVYGKTISSSFILNLKEKYPNMKIKSDVDLIDSIWKDRPSITSNSIYKLEDSFSGESLINKLSKINKDLNDYETNCIIISSLEEQAWLYNLRGTDVKNTPVFLSFTVILDGKVFLFIDNTKINKDLNEYLLENNIAILSYDEIYSFISKITNKKIQLNFNSTNYNIYNSINSTNEIINGNSPIHLLKSIKNDTEINNTKVAHIKDGVSMVKFLYYFNDNRYYLSELTASNALNKFRRQNANYLEDSFNTICAFKEHGALMHYSASKESNYSLNQSGFLLIDSGAHYLEGTTDITRTFLLGEASSEMKLHYTTVLKSLINLSSAIFLRGIKGNNLDILARGPIWKLLIDYKCGTGHGVGHILSVHEGPNSFRWASDTAVLLPGMITTNEPGIYLKGKYGIRLENELLVREYQNNEFGEFLKFETITYCPFDLNAIDETLLTQEEKQWLNNYHLETYNKLSPYLNIEEKQFLRELTKEI